MIDEVLLQQFDQSEILDQMARYHLQTGGKRLRGRLAILAARDFEVNQGQALLWAAACELLHNATLIHDDIQDNDPIRRGHPSLWKKYGVAQAINVGDLLIFKAFHLASQLNQPQLTLLLAQTSEKLVKGQSAELDFTTKISQYWDAYLRVAQLKTGVLFQLPFEGIHLIKHKDPLSGYDYARSWSQLGIVYQIFDDINDFLGLKQKGQKQKDLHEKRINAIVACISKDRMYHSLIKDYLDCEVGSKEQREVISLINNIALKEGIISSLQAYGKKLLDQFQKGSPSSAKNLILQEMQETLTKEKRQNESLHI